MRKSIIASLLSLSTLSQAHAQPPICELGGVCVYDKNGFIGVLTDSATPVLARKLDHGVIYAIEFSADTGVLSAEAAFLYPNSTCSGSPYMAFYNSFPKLAFADNNKVMWAATGPAMQVTINSVWIPGRSGCFEERWGGPIPVGVATVVDSTVVKSWVPPFTPDPPGISLSWKD